MVDYKDCIDERPKMNNTEKYLWLNGLIMDFAIRGRTDCIESIDIYWKVAGRYAFVFIVEYTGKMWFRIITCQNDFRYDQNQILQSIDNCVDSQIVYGYFKNINGSEQKLQKWETGNWLEESTALVAREINEY